MDSFYGTIPDNHTATWHPEPIFRGTFSILSTCIITMGLCVWTAVHLNIPKYRDSGIFQFSRKIMWLFIGLFAPELVVWVAFEQRKEASRVHKSIKRCLRQHEKPNLLKRTFCMSPLIRLLWREKATNSKRFDDRHEWTMIHSFYTVMGGFAIDVSGNKLFAPLGSCQRYTLTSDGLSWVAEWGPELIPNISKAEIQDKSKANGLAKTLICLQALWFCTQCVIRLSGQFTITLLELNTFAHALCTLCIYVLWWEKPLDIEEPTIFSNQDDRVATAFIFCCGMEHDAFFKEVGKRRFLDNSSFFEPFWDLLSTLSLAAFPKYYVLPQHEHQTYYNILRRACYRQSEPSCAPRRRRHQLNEPTDTISPTVTIRTAKFEYSLSASSAPLSLRNSDWPLNANIRNFNFSLILAGVCYGGLHSTAWNAPFPTANQEMFWKTSSLAVAFNYPLLVLVGYVHHRVQPFIENLSHELLISCFQKMSMVVMYAMYYCAIFLATLYGLCRVFLFVECFIAMAHLPDSVYQVPEWSQYFPHIG